MRIKHSTTILKSLLCALIICLYACTPATRDEHTLIVGTISGPETELMHVAADVAKKKFKLDIKIVEFEDYVLPNAALADGTLDANMIQHQPYLTQSIATHHYPIESIGKTFIYPMGAYSKKYKDLSDIAPESTIAIPNDPSNATRALLLLHEAGLIQLTHTNLTNITPHDIQQSTLKLNIIELDAAQLPRALSDVDLAIINTNYAILAGLLPSRDALLLETADSPYANVVVVRSAEKEAPKYQHLLNALHSQAVQHKADELFKRQAIRAW